MFAVPGNRYTALAFLASDEAESLRSRAGISPVEHEAISRIADHSERWRQYSLQCGECQSYAEELAVRRPEPNGVQYRDCGDGEHVWHYGLVSLRMQTNTGCDSVNVGVDTANDPSWPLSNFASTQPACVRLSDEQIAELCILTTRDSAGRHFTEWSDHYESLEEAGLITIERPVHQGTGIGYDCQHWTVEVTPKGLEVVESHPELHPS